MNIKLYFIRKIKGLFIKFKLHLLFEPLFPVLINLAYLSKLSRWCSNQKDLPVNDFYNSAVKYQDRQKLHNYIFESEKLDQQIDYLEFGVAEGLSFGWWVSLNKNEKSRFWGFDTFTGLPEDFGVMKKEDYDTNGVFPPINDRRVKFIPGLFQKSLDEFLLNYSRGPKLVVHLDADLYSSTLYVFTKLHPFLRDGDIIIFDEFGVPTHEFKAFSEFVHAYDLQYEVLGAINNYLQLSIKIKK